MKGITLATIFFLIMMLLDFASTLLVGKELIKHLETNLLYPYIGLAGIFVLNLGVAAVFHYGYIYSNNLSTRHALIFTLVMVSILRIFVIYNNYLVYKHPVSVEVAASIPQAVKTKFYWGTVIKPILMTWGTAVITFWMFKKDHKMTSEV